MINTKFNHVELYKIVEKEINNDEMISIQKDLIKNNIYHCIQGSNGKILNIKTLMTNKIKYINSDYVNDDEFDNFIEPIKQFKLNAKNELHKFVNNAYSQNGSIIYKPSTNNISNLMANCGGEIINMSENYHPNENTILYDHSRSYSRFQECKYYDGFPTVFTDFCSGPFDIEFIKKHVGVYKISNVDLSSCNLTTKKHLEKLNIFSHDIFISPELIFYNDIGVKFTIDLGTYCDKTININKFTDDVIENKKYSEFIGRLGHISEFHKYKVFTTKEHAEVLNSEFGDGNEIYEGSKYINVQYPKADAFSYVHIAGFFTGYSRIQILEQLFNIDYDSVECVNVDGIFTNCKIDAINEFVIINYSGEWFYKFYFEF
jgi:hypothetical protein